MNPALAAIAGPQQQQQYAPAVVDGVIQFFSVSQLRAFATCERQWWFSKVKRFKKPQRKYLETGTDVHKQLEHYLTTGEDVLGALARPMKPFLPEPGEGLYCEQKIGGHEFPLHAAGLPLTGSIDLLNVRRVSERVIRVTDFKTTSSIDKYAAQPDQLASPQHESGNGIQMIGYSVAVAEAARGEVDRVELEHIYTQTKGAKRAESRLTVVDVDEARSRWTYVDGLGERAKVIARAQSLDEVRPNWRACDKYGGCPFQQHCLSHAAGAPAQTTRSSMGILDKLKQKNAEQTTSTTPPPAAAAPAPASTGLPKMQIIETKGFAAKLAKPGEKYVLPDGRTGTFNKPIDAGGAAQLYSFDVGAARPALLDADELIEFAPAPKPELTVQYDAGQAPTKPTTTAPVEVAPVIPPDATPAAVAIAEKKAEVAEAEKPKNKRGAKKGSEEQAQAPAPTAAQPQSIGDALRVYVDAIPNGPSEPLAGYLGPLVAEIERMLGVEDIRVGPNDSPLAFGKWKGVLAAAIKAAPPKPGTYVALGTAGSEIVQVAAEALESLCAPGNFVRGVR